MNAPDTAFQKLFARAPTDEERLTLYRTKDTLGLRDDDSLWLIFIALQYHHKLYDEIPERIRAVTKEAVAAAKAAAEVEARAAASEAQAAMTYAISETAQKVARQVAGRRMAATIAGAVIIAFTTIGGALWAGWQLGVQQHAGLEIEADARGYQRGLEEARMERAAAEWGASPEGRMAYQLAIADSGNIAHLAQCEGTGWQIKEWDGKRACIPEKAKGSEQIYGWMLPLPPSATNSKTKK